MTELHTQARAAADQLRGELAHHRINVAITEPELLGDRPTERVRLVARVDSVRQLARLVARVPADTHA